MRILVVAGEVPFPPDQGGRIRMDAILTQLSKRHEVHLIAVAVDPVPSEAADHLNHICASVEIIARSQTRFRRVARLARSLATRQPFIMAKHMSPQLRARVAVAIKRVSPDVLLAELHYVADAIIGQGAPTVVDLYNIDSMLYERFAKAARVSIRKLHGLIQRPIMRRYERQLPERVTACVTVSDVDRNLLMSLAGARNVAVVPNGVDVEFFHPETVTIYPSDVVFVGSMDYYPNTDGALYLVQDIMPLVWRTRPDTTVSIVGRNPGRALRALARDPRVTVTGRVADVRPYFKGGAVAVVPIRIGGGSRLKAVEAAAMGRPIVGTSVGLEGSGLVTGATALFADTAESFASAVLDLLTNEDLGQRLGKQARTHVVQNLAWPACVDKLEKVLQSAAAP